MEPRHLLLGDEKESGERAEVSFEASGSGLEQNNLNSTVEARTWLYEQRWKLILRHCGHINKEETLHDFLLPRGQARTPLPQSAALLGDVFKVCWSVRLHEYQREALMAQVPRCKREILSRVYLFSSDSLSYAFTRLPVA